MVRNSNYEKFSIALFHYYVVGKAFENDALGTVRSSCTRHRHQGHKLFLQQVKGCVHGVLKIYPEARLLQFIPRSCFHCFVSRSFENLDFGHQADVSRARIRRRNSSLSIRVAVPASICPSLRKISRSQASAASGSPGSSRLTIKSWANCARSDSDSRKASDRNVSKIVLPIQVIPFMFLLPRQRFQNSAPNYLLQRRAISGVTSTSISLARRALNRSSVTMTSIHDVAPREVVDGPDVPQPRLNR